MVMVRRILIALSLCWPMLASAQQNPQPIHFLGPLPTTAVPHPSKPKPAPAGFLNGFEFSGGCGRGSTPATVVQHFGDLDQAPTQTGHTCSAEVSHTLNRSGRLELIFAYEQLATSGTGPYQPKNVAQLLPPGIVSQSTSGIERITENAPGIGLGFNAWNSEQNILRIAGLGFYHHSTERFGGTSQATDFELDSFVEPATDLRKNNGLRPALDLSYTRLLFGDLGVTPAVRFGPSMLYTWEIRATLMPGRTKRFKPIRLWKQFHKDHRLQQ